MKKFVINKNNYLEFNTDAYFNRFYYKLKKGSDFPYLNIMKNFYGNESVSELEIAKCKISDILIEDLPQILKNYSFSPDKVIFLCVPRSKAIKNYKDTQLFFLNSIKIALKQLNFLDETDCIIREIDTKTTHIKADTTMDGRKIINEGKLPYPGITKDTCKINFDKINGANIILIDDIYTFSVNIDEDCIQTLYNIGANKVIFYSIGKTKGDDYEYLFWYSPQSVSYF